MLTPNKRITLKIITGSACAVGRCFDIGVNSNSGVRVLNVGGNYNANANYGFFYFNANNNASNANSNIGSRLTSVKTVTYCAGLAMPLGKNIIETDGA